MGTTVVGQIGCGYWGPNLLRNFVTNGDCTVKLVADERAERRTYVETHFSGVRTSPDWRTVVGDSTIEGVIIATPALTHFELAKAALEAGKHVLVEKPLCTHVSEVDQLLTIAAQQKRVLMVGHTFLYNPAVRFLKTLLDGGQLGDVYYMYAQRLNLGQIRTDVNAWWNLAPHDVSIFLYLMSGALPGRVTAYGLDYIQPGIADVVFSTVAWPSQVAGHIHVSWLDPGKVRRVAVVGTKKMAIYDDVSDHKLAVLDRGFDRIPRIGDTMDYDIPSFQLRQRTGDVWMPHIEPREPLAAEAQEFIDCIRSGREPLTNGNHARDVVQILEAADTSLKAAGATATLSGRERAVG